MDFHLRRWLRRGTRSKRTGFIDDVTAAPSSPLTVTALAPGTVLGRYELLLPIAAGGMAMVWAARLTGSRGFQKVFAVKTMLPQMSEDDQFEQMFLDEASLASQIKHPHAVEILDLGEQGGVLFLAMRLSGTPSIHSMTRNRTPPCSPRSRISTACGCLICEASEASSRNICSN